MGSETCVGEESCDASWRVVSRREWVVCFVAGFLSLYTGATDRIHARHPSHRAAPRGASIGRSVATESLQSSVVVVSVGRGAHDARESSVADLSLIHI